MLKSYKSLHRTILQVFEDDSSTVKSARAKVREEFMKNANEKDTNKIEELLKVADDVQNVLRKDVVQAIKNEKGHYKLKLRAEHLRDNAGCASREPTKDI